jgi:transposase
MAVTPEEGRWAIITEWKRCNESVSATAQQLQLSVKAVKHWVSVYQATGSVKPAHKTGRRRALSRAAANKAHALLLDESQRSSQMVAVQLQQEGITPVVRDKKTVIRAARRVGMELGRPIVARRGKPRKQLTQTNKNARVAFCQSNVKRNWDNVMITDRKRFLFHHPGTVVKPVRWMERGQRWQAPKVNHPQGVNVYAGLTRYGVTSMQEVTGTSTLCTSYTTKRGIKSKNITQDEYRAVLSGTLLKEGCAIFSKHKHYAWLLQQDNDKAHKEVMKTVSSWSRQGSCTIGLVQSWPPNSPDLSPIENLWSLVQSRVTARGCNTFAEFRAAVHDEWAKVTPALARQYMSSIPARLAKCIEVNGEMTRY